jgi:hypothetical protein
LCHLYGVKTAADTSELAKSHAAKVTYAPYVWEGVAFFACSLSREKSFLPCRLEGYWMERVPLFATTSAAVYGRVIFANRGLWLIHIVSRPELQCNTYLPPSLDLGNLLSKTGFFARHWDKSMKVAV